MFRKRKKAYASIFVLLTVFVLVVSVPPSKAQFVLAAWEYPDEYGQGIDAYRIYENSTGSWVPAWFSYGYAVYNDTFSNDIFTWNASLFIMLRFWTLLNKTLVGVTTTEAGKNYIQHSIIVENLADSIVFSQQNFTYFDCESNDGDPIYYYVYDIVLDFLPLAGESYTVTVTYEIWW